MRKDQIMKRISVGIVFGHEPCTLKAAGPESLFLFPFLCLLQSRDSASDIRSLPSKRRCPILIIFNCKS